MQTDIWDKLTGPQGGIFGAGLAMGSILAFGFLEKFMYKTKIKDFEERIIILEGKAAKYDDLMESLANVQLTKLDDSDE